MSTKPTTDIGGALLAASGYLWAMHAPMLSEIMNATGWDGLRLRASVLDTADGCGDENPCGPEMVNGIAVVDICGPITPAASLLCCFGIQAVSLDMIGDALDEAVSGGARAVLLRINSPGGSLGGIADLMGAIAETRAKMPVVAALGGYAASLACWIACGCDAVHASPETLGASIGVFTMLDDSTEAYKQMGVRRRVIGSGPYKGTGIGGVPVTDEQVAEVQRSVDATNALFIEGIAAGRGMSVDEVKALATGAVMVGQQLVDAGLADSIATPRQVLAGMLANPTR